MCSRGRIDRVFAFLITYNFYTMGQPHISISAENLFRPFGIPITNSILTTWVVMVILALLAFFVARPTSPVPSKFRLCGEIIIEKLSNLFTSVMGETSGKKFFPFLATIFLFIIVSNWSGLIPGVGSIGLQSAHEFIPLFRAPTADLNTTLALALIAVIAVQYAGVRSLKGSYFKKFINLSNPIMFFVGLLEIVSEFSRIISFTFRLFGNIFAGEVLLTVIAFLIPVLVPIPFLGLELFVGFIQALVFSMLTATFLLMATSHEGSHH